MTHTAQTLERAPADDGDGLRLPFVTLQNVTWQTYQALLSDLGEHRSARLTYDCGTLEIKMPSKLHELLNRLLERIIVTLTEELDMEVLSFGSTTFDNEELKQGVEPDSCFYIQNASRVNPEDDSPPQDFPPDLVVEVDITSSSKSRLNIYRVMGVEEVWRYKHSQLIILQLQEGEYMECESSSVFPMLSGNVLNGFLNQGKRSSNHNSLISELRLWLNNLK